VSLIASPVDWIPLWADLDSVIARARQESERFLPSPFFLEFLNGRRRLLPRDPTTAAPGFGLVRLFGLLGTALTARNRGGIVRCVMHYLRTQMGLHRRSVNRVQQTALCKFVKRTAECRFTRNAAQNPTHASKTTVNTKTVDQVCGRRNVQSSLGDKRSGQRFARIRRTTKPDNRLLYKFLKWGMSFAQQNCTLRYGRLHRDRSAKPPQPRRGKKSIAVGQRRRREAEEEAQPTDRRRQPPAAPQGRDKPESRLLWHLFEIRSIERYPRFYENRLHLVLR